MPAKFDRCVKKVKKKSGKKVNPYAVCRSTLGSDANIKKREKRKRNSKRKK